VYDVRIQRNILQAQKARDLHMSLGMIDEPSGKARVAVINAAAFCAHVRASKLAMTMPRFSLRNFCAIYRPPDENQLIEPRKNESEE